MKDIISAIIVCLLVAGTARAQETNDSVLNGVIQYFKEIKQVCESPEAELWGKELYGPLLFVDPSTRQVYANMPDKEGILKADQSVYTGNLPKAINLANTAIQWAGTRWAMVLLPLPAAYEKRMNLVVHELFHRVQPDLGFLMRSPTSDHLDTREGRTWFRLELNALRAALQKPAQHRQKELRDALVFRKYRYQLFPDAAGKEEALEWNEGLAEFTGVWVSGISKHSKNYLINRIDSANTYYPTFTRSFAYLTGPVYGSLLSQRETNWLQKIDSTDNFMELVSKAWQIQIPRELKKEANKQAVLYDGVRIRKEESLRENKRLATEKKYIAQLVAGPVLELKTTKKMSFSFNPNTIFPLGKYGSVYSTMTMVDDWGRLVVMKEVLFKDWKLLYVAVPDAISEKGNIVKGDGWELELKDGWKIVAGRRKGDYKLLKE